MSKIFKMVVAKRVRQALLVIATVAACVPLSVQAERLKDLATIQGVRENPLVGYGLVVGLDGSGDQVRQTPFTQQSLTNMLSQLGVTVPHGTNMQVKNVAAVMVTTSLPAYAQAGQTIDVNVSALGNAKSLRGGTLLMTPLKGADNNVYAIAQGNIVVGGAGVSAGGSSVQVNQLNGGIISNGATIERVVPTKISFDGVVRVELIETDFGTANNAAVSINKALGPNLARAINGRVIEVTVPSNGMTEAELVARIQNVDVPRSRARAKIIINARTGTVVMNQSVTLDNAAVAYGSLSVVVDRSVAVSQPNTPFGGGNTVIVPQTSVGMEFQQGQLQKVERSVNLNDVIRALNALGATPQDLLSILQALKAAGSLRADLEIV